MIVLITEKYKLKKSIKKRKKKKTEPTWDEQGSSNHKKE